MEQQRRSFWGWLADNPITAVVILLTLLGAAALFAGYKEGAASVITGLFTWLKGDSENKQRLEESRRQTDAQFSVVNRHIQNMQEQQILHDMEVTQDVENAKAEYDDMDIDELVDIGNAMLRDHGAFRDTARR